MYWLLSAGNEVDNIYVIAFFKTGNIIILFSDQPVINFNDQHFKGEILFIKQLPYCHAASVELFRPVVK